jgi:thymidylate kinase
MLIVIEGPDFAGKSTVAKLLRRRLEARGHRIVARQLALVESHGVGSGVAWAQDLPRRWGGIKSLLFFASELIDAFFWTDSPLVVTIRESYGLRTLATAEARGWRTRAAALRWVNRRLPRPDVAVYLACDRHERASRSLTALSRDARDDERFAPDNACQLRSDRRLEVLARNAGYLVIDTEKESGEGAVDRILASAFDRDPT